MIDPTITGKNLIEVFEDTKGKGIRIYTTTLRRYQKFKSISDMVSQLGLNIVRRKDMHGYYKEIGDKLGISAKEALSWYNAIAYKHFVASLDNFHVKKFALNPIKKQVIPQALHQINKCKDKLDQVKKDGIYHIAPFIVESNSTPEELKKSFGKGKWKKLTKNSFTRNKLIVSNRNFIQDEDILEDIPTSIIKNLPLFHKEILLYVKNNLKGKWTNKSEINYVATLVLDTQRMATQLNRDFSFNWSIGKMEEEHDRMITINRNNFYNQINSNASSNEPVPYYDHFEKLNLTKIEKDGYTAVLLKTPFDYTKEGAEMNHCVGGYGSIAKNGTYAVYSITNPELRRSTLGMYKNPNGVTIQQHYGPHNTEVDKGTEEFAHYLEKFINSELRS